MKFEISYLKIFWFIVQKFDNVFVTETRISIILQIVKSVVTFTQKYGKVLIEFETLWQSFDVDLIVVFV